MILYKSKVEENKGQERKSLDAFVLSKHIRPSPPEVDLAGSVSDYFFNWSIDSKSSSVITTRMIPFTKVQHFHNTLESHSKIKVVNLSSTSISSNASNWHASNVYSLIGICVLLCRSIPHAQSTGSFIYSFIHSALVHRSSFTSHLSTRQVTLGLGLMQQAPQKLKD